MNKHLRLNITRRCSLRCPYCVSNKFKANARKDSYLENVGPKVFLDQIDRLLVGKDVRGLTIDLKGEGDVLQSPYITDVVEWALVNHYNLEFQTNLFGFSQLAHVFDQHQTEHSRVKFSISYHIGAFNPKHLSQFWLAFELLRDYIKKGSIIPGKVDIPLAPKIRGYDNFEIDLSIFKREGFTLNPAILVGTLDGKPYPTSYTPEEQIWVENILATYKPVEPMNYRWTRAQIPWVTHQLDLKGEPCTVRMRTVDVMADGRIRYCQCKPPYYAPKSLKDLTTPEDYAAIGLFLDEPVPCPGDICGCMSRGRNFSLKPRGISLHQYFEQYYRGRNMDDIADLFKEGPSP